MKEKRKEKQRQKRTRGTKAIVKGWELNKYRFIFKASLYFSIQPDKIRKSEIFTTFRKIHLSFINSLKSEETKSQIKAHLSYLANSYFYSYTPSPRIVSQHRVLRNLRKNKDIITTKPDKGNGVVILDRKLYDNPTQEIITKLNLKSSMKTQLWNVKLHYNVFYVSCNKKTFLTKMNMINCMLQVLINCILLLLSIVLLKFTNFLLVIHFQNFVQLFHL